MVIQILTVKGRGSHPNRFRAASITEHHRVHDAAGRQSEEAGDHQRADENRDSTRWRLACMTASGSIASVKNDSRWIGLHASQTRKSWMKNELTATITMSATQIHPAVRCGSVPLGALSCIAPSAKAAMAVKACSWMAGSAFNNGASDTAVLRSTRRAGIVSTNSSAIMAVRCAT